MATLFAALAGPWAAASTNTLVAGGYGLFLKQRWLSEGFKSRTVVPIQNWRDATPRVTNVPNPVTWSVTKLTATGDRWALSQDPQLEEEPREYSRVQAAKHAQDVYRIVAMMTMEERDRAREVVASIVETDAFRIATQCWRNHFSENPISVVQQLGAKWLSDDAATIRDVLAGWFG